jgi:hypothetical protein
MTVEKTTRDFGFESTLLATFLPKCMGLMLIWMSFYLLDGWLHPSWHRLPYLVILLPFGLFLWAVAGMMLYGYCYVRILDGQFGFRRFFAWRSAPLESIAKVEFYRGLGMYVWVSYAGKRQWVVFHPDNLQLSVQLRRSPPPVIQFLREICNANASKSKPQP